MRTAIFTEPCIIEISWEGGESTIPALDAFYETDDGYPVLLWGDGETYRVIRLTGEPSQTGGQFRSVTHNGEADLLVRSVRPSDAMMGYGSLFSRGFPMPVDVIQAMIVSEVPVPPELEALVREDGWVETIILIADTGLYARYSNAWQRVPDPADFLDGHYVVSVGDEAVSMWDSVDSAGRTMAAADLPITDDSAPDRPTDARSVTAAGQLLMEREVIVKPIIMVDDIPAAIQAAADAPEARWYVERRLDALGVRDQFPLPWRS